MDLAEVESKTMSRKAYMKKWRGLTDDEVQEELEQIALERQMLEESSFAASGNTEPYPSGGTGNQDESVNEDELIDELVDEPTDDDDMI